MTVIGETRPKNEDVKGSFLLMRENFTPMREIHSSKELA